MASTTLVNTISDVDNSENIYELFMKSTSANYLVLEINGVQFKIPHVNRADPLVSARTKADSKWLKTATLDHKIPKAQASILNLAMDQMEKKPKLSKLVHQSPEVLHNLFKDATSVFCESHIE